MKKKKNAEGDAAFRGSFLEGKRRDIAPRQQDVEVPFADTGARRAGYLTRGRSS